MLRLFAMGRRKAALTRGEYHHALLQRHAPLVKGCEAFRTYCRHYHQNHIQGPVNGGAGQGLDEKQARFDNISEFWFDDLDAVVKTFSHPSYLQQVRPDEPNWTDGDSRIAFIADETEVPALGASVSPAAATTKLLVLVPHVASGAGDMLLALPSVDGSVRQIENKVLGVLDFQRGQLAENKEPPFLHVSEVWFDDPARLGAWLRSGGTSGLRGEAFWATEHKII